MARTINTIQQQILNGIASNAVLSALDSTSQVAIYRLISYIISTNIAVEEQLNDLFISETESQANLLAPGTQEWIQNKTFQFQYNTSNPQIIQFATNSIVPFYPNVNVNYQIITNCSVISSDNKPIVYIKVAKGGSGTTTPQQLITGEIQALQNYWNIIGPAGIKYQCSSNAADRIQSIYTVIAQGAYSAVIAQNLKNAYNQYLFSLPFDGIVKKIDIDLALRNVPGVIDVICNKMVPRPNSESFGIGSQTMVSDNTVLLPEYNTAAGYIIDEDTSGEDFLSTLILQFK